eukprot:COSAG01_NODE_46460_length_400_cov_0.601329_1_plen_46_part_10
MLVLGCKRDTTAVATVVVALTTRHDGLRIFRDSTYNMPKGSIHTYM